MKNLAALAIGLLYMMGSLPACADNIRAKAGEVVYVQVKDTLQVNSSQFILDSYNGDSEKDSFLVKPVCGLSNRCSNLMMLVSVGVADSGQRIEVLKADAYGSLVVVPISR